MSLVRFERAQWVGGGCGPRPGDWDLMFVNPAHVLTVDEDQGATRLIMVGAENVPMRFVLTFACDNDAFVPEATTEVLAILKRVRNAVADGRLSGAVIDTNGNTVGD
jgi:hypothetical protein